MRKVVKLATSAAVLVAFAVPGAHAQEPGIDASVNQFAYATNIVRHGDHDYMYLVGAERVTHAAGRTRTTAFAKRTRCLTLERKRIKLIVCAAFVFPKKIPESAFEFDPLMESASVRIRGKGKPSAMRWAGRGVPEPNVAPFADASYGAGAYAELYRGARATGRILGERYPKGPMGFALLMQGAVAEGYTSRNVSITPAGDGYLVTARYRTRR